LRSQKLVGLGWLVWNLPLSVSCLLSFATAVPGFPFPPVRPVGESGGLVFKVVPRDLVGRENGQSVRFPSLSVPFCKRARPGEYFRGGNSGTVREGARKRKGPPPFGGGLRGEVPCFLVGWIGWIYPCSGEKKEGSFKDGDRLRSPLKDGYGVAGWNLPLVTYY